MRWRGHRADLGDARARLADWPRGGCLLLYQCAGEIDGIRRPAETMGAGDDGSVPPSSRNPADPPPVDVLRLLEPVLSLARFCVHGGIHSGCDSGSLRNLLDCRSDDTGAASDVAADEFSDVSHQRPDVRCARAARAPECRRISHLCVCLQPGPATRQRRRLHLRADGAAQVVGYEMTSIARALLAAFAAMVVSLDAQGQPAAIGDVYASSDAEHFDALRLRTGALLRFASPFQYAGVVAQTT